LLGDVTRLRLWSKAGLKVKLSRLWGKRLKDLCSGQPAISVTPSNSNSSSGK
jgi:hypothetical protein